MNRFNYYCGKWIRHGTYYPDRKLRLLDINKGKWGGQNPHDKIMMQESTTIHHLEGDLLHYTVPDNRTACEANGKIQCHCCKALFDKGEKPSYFKMVINPAWAFIKGYLLKLGFLDGAEGFRIARFTAKQSYLKYVKLIQLHLEAKK